MKKFNYKVINEEGKKIEGIVEALDEKKAAELLRSKNFFIISVKSQRDSLLKVESLSRRVTLEDKVNFTRQLSTMISSGLALTEALSILQFQAKPGMGRVIGEILTDVEGGSGLADALKRQPRVFDKFYVALISAGEAAGILDVILKRLADNLENSKNLRSRIKAAMIYPLIIILGMVAVSLVMLIFVIPRMMVFYQEFQAELPLPTKIFLGISEFVRRFWWLGAIILGGMIFSTRFLDRFPQLKKGYDELYFKIPLFGKLRQQIMLAEFTRTLGLLIGAGVLMVDALNIVKDSFSSQVYRQALSEATREVEKGFPLSYALAKTEAFPLMISQMVNVGEETGKMDEVLVKVSSYFDQEAEILVKGLTSALEPFIMVILALGVAFLVIAVIMPIYSLTTKF